MAKIELAERAVACKHWRWMPGMLLVSGERVLFVTEDAVCLVGVGEFCEPHKLDWENFCALPEFDDAATECCLVRLVREAWGERMVDVEQWESGFTVTVIERSTWNTAHDGDWCESLGLALVAALEAAP